MSVMGWYASYFCKLFQIIAFEIGDFGLFIQINLNIANGLYFVYIVLKIVYNIIGISTWLQ